MSIWSHVYTINHIDVSDSAHEMVRLWVEDNDEVITMTYDQAERLANVLIAIVKDNDGS